MSAPRVKPLVWEHHPVGLIAGASWGSAYIIDTRRPRPRIIKGLTFAREFDTLDDAKAAAQADYEARILAALEHDPDIEALVALCGWYFGGLSPNANSGGVYARDILAALSAMKRGAA